MLFSVIVCGHEFVVPAESDEAAEAKVRVAPVIQQWTAENAENGLTTPVQVNPLSEFAPGVYRLER